MNETQLVVFSLKGMPFGAEAEEIAEVIRQDVLHKNQDCSKSKEHNLPCMEGYVNVRGNMVPVVSLGKYLGLEETPIPPNAKIILVKYNEKFAGFIVDNVTEILRLDESSIKNAPSVITTPENKYIEKFVVKDESVFPVISFKSILMKNQE